jgi:hypothetical protein
VEYFRLRTAIRSIEQNYRTEHIRPRNIIGFARSIKKGAVKLEHFWMGLEVKNIEL